MHPNWKEQLDIILNILKKFTAAAMLLIKYIFGGRE